MQNAAKKISLMNSRLPFQQDLWAWPNKKSNLTWDSPLCKAPKMLITLAAQKTSGDIKRLASITDYPIPPNSDEQLLPQQH